MFTGGSLKLTALLGITMIALLVAAATSAGDRKPSKPVAFEDGTIRVQLPAGWSIEGEAGEYQLESDDQDMGSMLLIPFDSDTTLEERLAEIDQQFLATGIIELEAAEERKVDGQEISYRRYRVKMADGEDTEGNSVMLHQYVFSRNDVHALVQVESAAERSSSEELFTKIFKTLEVLETPIPFEVDDMGANDE
jgi:hypothetical protein